MFLPLILFVYCFAVRLQSTLSHFIPRPPPLLKLLITLQLRPLLKVLIPITLDERIQPRPLLLLLRKLQILLRRSRSRHRLPHRRTLRGSLVGVVDAAIDEISLESRKT